jgi:dihydrodipicolinate synthase/N-acetylneuraminate lyase
VRYHQAILVSCEIPWDERENLLEDVFRAGIRHFRKLGFDNLYIFGTAGEGYAVDTQRFRRIVEVFREETASEGLFPQVGVIGLSTAAVIERIQYAYDAGFRMFQISLPSWGALNDAEMLRFFRDVCGAFPDAKFLHYNLPRAKRVLTPADYRHVGDAVPNLAATKNTGLTMFATVELMRTVPELQHFFGEAQFPAACLHGECSLLSSFGPVFPRKTRELFNLARCGATAEAFALQARYLAVVTGMLAPMFRHSLMDGAYDKALVRLGGFDMPLRLLSPYDALPEETLEECRRILDLDEKYPDWD